MPLFFASLRRVSAGRCRSVRVPRQNPAGRTSPVPQPGHLLLWQVERNPLPLHLLDDAFGALVTVGGELGGLAGERFELLAQLDCLLNVRLLRAPQLRQGAAIMDR